MSTLSSLDTSSFQRYSNLCALYDSSLVSARDVSTVTAQSPRPMAEFHLREDEVNSSVSGNMSVDSGTRDSHGQQLTELPSCDEIQIERREYPQEFKEKHYDVLLIYTVQDTTLAEGFRYILEHCVRLENDERPTVYMLDSEHLAGNSSKFASLAEALKRSTYIFMLITPTFCSDSWAEAQRDECLMESIENPQKRWCVIPILNPTRISPPPPLPFGLRSLKGVNAARIFTNSAWSLEMFGSSTPPQLNIDDIDNLFIRNVTAMLNARINLKLVREAEQTKSLNKWIEEEKVRRWQKRVMENHQRRETERRRQLRQQQFVDSLSRMSLSPDNLMQSQGENPGQTVDNHDTYSSSSSSNLAQQQPQVVQFVVNIHGNIGNAQFGDDNEMKTLTRAESESSMDSCDYEVVVDRSPPQIVNRSVGLQPSFGGQDQVYNMDIHAANDSKFGSAHSRGMQDGLPPLDSLVIDGVRLDASAASGRDRQTSISPSVTTDGVGMLRSSTGRSDEWSALPQPQSPTALTSGGSVAPQAFASSQSFPGTKEGSGPRYAARLNSVPVAIVEPTVATSPGEPVPDEHTKPMVFSVSLGREETTLKSVVVGDSVAETRVKQVETESADRRLTSVESVQPQFTSGPAYETVDTCVKQISDLCSSNSRVVPDQYFSAIRLVSPPCVPPSNTGLVAAFEMMPRSVETCDVIVDQHLTPTQCITHSASLREVDSRTSTGLARPNSQPTIENKSHHSKDAKQNSGSGSQDKNCIVS